MLSAKNRFHRRNHVNRVYREGKSARSGALSLKYRVAPKGEEVKFAVAVSKKVSKSAVKRNRIRRRIFELLRQEIDGLPPGFEGVLGVFDASISDLPHDQLKKHVHNLLNQATQQKSQKSK